MKTHTTHVCNIISKYNGIIRKVSRAVASFKVPGWQEFNFPHFSSNFDQFFLFFLKLFSFSSSFWSSGWGSRPPGKALATPLKVRQFLPSDSLPTLFNTLVYSYINYCAIIWPFSTIL